jgi:hypothetical protein
MSKLEENWLPVNKWPYEISNCGNVRRMKGGRGAPAGNRLDASARGMIQLSKPSATGCGSLIWRVRLDYLVLLTFDGPARGRRPRHLDGDPDNNALANLLWERSGEVSGVSEPTALKKRLKPRTAIRPVRLPGRPKNTIKARTARIERYQKILEALPRASEPPMTFKALMAVVTSAGIAAKESTLRAALYWLLDRRRILVHVLQPEDKVLGRPVAGYTRANQPLGVLMDFSSEDEGNKDDPSP